MTTTANGSRPTSLDLEKVPSGVLASKTTPTKFDRPLEVALEIARKASAVVAKDTVAPLQKSTLNDYIPYNFLNQSNEEVDMMPELWQAAVTGDVAKLQEIKQKNATVTFDEVDLEMRTPLHLAASQGKVEAVKFLLTEVKNISPTDRRGHSPLTIAYHNGHSEVANLLSEAVNKQLSRCGTWSCENDPGTLVLFHDLQRLGSHISHTTYGQAGWYDASGRHNYEKFFELMSDYGVHVVNIQDIILANIHHPDFHQFMIEQIHCEVDGATESREVSQAQSVASLEEINAFKEQLISGMDVEQLVLAVTHRVTVKLQKTRDGALMSREYSIAPLPNLMRGRLQICTSKGVCLVGAHSSSNEAHVLQWCYQRLGLPILDELPDPLRMSGRDFVPAGPELCFMGTGVETENAAVNYMLTHDIFGTPRVAVVRDLFKRGAALESHFKLISSTHCVLSDDVDNVRSRRLVTEYIQIRGTSELLTGGMEGVVLGRYACSRRDVPFRQYLTELGYKIIDVPAQHDLSLSIYSMGNGRLLIADPDVYELLAKIPELPCTLKQGYFEGVANHYQYLYKSSLMFRRPEPGTSLPNVPPMPILEPPYTTWSSIRDPNPRQTTFRVLMVAPVGFQTNVETAADNYFMKPSENSPMEIEKRALREFAELHEKLTKAGVDVMMFCAERFHNTPDAVFPNNWFTTHPASELGQSSVVFYPMKTITRRNERRQNILSQLQSVYDREISFTMWETSDFPHFLEGTGTLVMDRVNKIAYAALSQRCYEKIAKAWALKLRYKLCLFHALDIQGRPIYHTNVMMSVGSTLAVVCLATVVNPTERKQLVDSLTRSGHTILDITMAQVDELCGNVLELCSRIDNRRLLCMSTRAYKAFTETQRAIIMKHVDEIVHADISTIETIGGGGVRCMLAELF